MAKNKEKEINTEISEKSGTLVEEMAADFGIPVNIVLSELREVGIKKKSGKDFISDNDFEKAYEHLEKVNTKQKSDQTGIHHSNSSPEPIKTKTIFLTGAVTVKELSEKLSIKSADLVKRLMSLNILATINQKLEHNTVEKICSMLNVEVINEDVKKLDDKKDSLLDEQAETSQVDDEANLKERPPVVTFLGHVDHGKTSIQDAIRKTNVVKGESGGITQHTGASVVTHKGKNIVFIDTPGHEAFTAMRARGANVTDIAVLVVAADDGFMPQTIEAMNHAKAAGVPIIVAINKMDLPTANPDKVVLHMQQNGLMSEDWGGEVGTIRVSAHTGKGLDSLLERIILEGEMIELKANPNKSATGVVLEAELEQGFGATANVIVRNGTLHVGDAILADQYSGKIKALIDHNGKRVKSIGPSMPAKVVGFSGVPVAGSKFKICKTDKEAAEIAKKRAEKNRETGLTKGASTTLEDLFSTLKNNERNDLNIVLKTDVQGTAEAIRDSLAKLPSDKIKVNIIHSAVGGISEGDVLLASASSAIIVGFHVKVNSGVNECAKREKVEIRLYAIIYELIEDIKDALEGRLAPESRENKIGKARILKIFSMTKGPKVCGCIVDEGTIKVNAKARVFRNKELIFNGNINSLKRFQDDVKEVKTGQECGIRLENFLDFQENDSIEAYEIEFRKVSL